MEFNLLFNGGIYKEANKEIKFLTFLVIDGQEIPMFQAQRLNLASVERPRYSNPDPKHIATLGYEHDDRVTNSPIRNFVGMSAEFWTVPTPIVKVFVSEYSVNFPKRYFSFYVRLQEGEPVRKLTIRPFDGTPPTFLFHAQGRLMKKSDVLDKVIFKDSNEASYSILKRQTYPSKSVLRRMITLFKEEEKILPNVRKIRLKRAGV